MVEGQADGGIPVERRASLRLRLPALQRPLRDALILVGVGRALYYFFVRGIQPWTLWGLDSRAYRRVDPAHPYLSSAPGAVSTYLYSPALTQVLALRFAAAVAIVLAGARTGRAWAVAVAVWLALPVSWVNSWVVLLGCIRLARLPSVLDARRTAKAPPCV